MGSGGGGWGARSKGGGMLVPWKEAPVVLAVKSKVAGVGAAGGFACTSAKQLNHLDGVLGMVLCWMYAPPHAISIADTGDCWPSLCNQGDDPSLYATYEGCPLKAMESSLRHPLDHLHTYAYVQPRERPPDSPILEDPYVYRGRVPFTCGDLYG